MNTYEKFLRFLSTLDDGINAPVLESIEKGFRHVFEGDMMGNIYATQISPKPSPKGDVIGTGVPGPADMLTEEVSKDSDMSKKGKEVLPKRTPKK